MNRVGFIVALGVILVVGGGLSFRDYRAWQYEETKSFGHGPSDNEPAVAIPELVQVYKNDVVQLRMRVPVDWAIKENSSFIVRNGQKPPVLDLLLPIEKRVEVARFGDRVQLAMQKTKLDLPDFVSVEAGKLKDRAYVSGNKVTFTLVQFPTQVVAYYARNGYVYVMTWNGINDGTFEAILKTVVIS